MIIIMENVESVESGSGDYKLVFEFGLVEVSFGEVVSSDESFKGFRDTFELA